MQIGQRRVALQTPIIEKKREICPNVVSPMTFLKSTYKIYKNQLIFITILTLLNFLYNTGPLV